MCYSAQIEAHWRRYRREYGARLSMPDFYDLFLRRVRGERIVVPKSVEVAFADAQGEDERLISALIAEHAANEAARLERELFKQRKRLADAERSLQTKATKTASESRRIATDKAAWVRARLESLRSPTLGPDDGRIFPGHHAPVIVMENGERVVKPMRYQCRPAGKPAFYDRKYPGTYNARRDNLGGFWKELFGVSHGLMLASAFFEHVQQAGANVVLEFRPRLPRDMLVACLWSRWSAPGQPDLLSFAAITDEPPPEVAAAGHDRCIIPIKPEHADAWLDPRGRRASMQDLLDDRERPFYEHRLAA